MKIETPPEQRTVTPPLGGWKERTYYVVRVAWNKGNPIHKAVFFTGFLNGPDGGPGGYSKVWSGSYEDIHPQYASYLAAYPHNIERVHFMEVVEEIKSMSEDE